MQDGARGSCKYLQDLILARSSKSIFQVLARISKTNVWQDGARWSWQDIARMTKTIVWQDGAR